MNPWIPHLLRAGGGGPVLPPAGRTMLANLMSSLILDEGTGGPAYSMGTAYWSTENDLGLLRQYPTGSAFFGGARLVRNLVPTPSNTLSVAGTKTVTLTQAATLQFSMGSGSGTATFSGTGGATGTLAAGVGRVSVNKTVTAGTFIVTASVDDLVDLSIVDVTGYDASYVPPYVSVGVVSTPFFGAGIDGVKYFETDWQGAPIAAANLLGFRREAAATNNCLQSRDLTKLSWQQSLAVGSELLVNGDFTVDSGWSKPGGFTIDTGTGKGVATAVGSGSNLNKDAGLVAGKVYLVTFTIDDISSGSIAPMIRGFVGTYRTVAGTYTESVTAGTSALYTGLKFLGTTTATVDNISIKEAAIQVTTCAGIDNVANSASTLTSGAADAIILQPITLASAARCASAYVKRKTGTGTIFFTQDGGSTWTDITSQINSSAWSRVQITSTLANPSVGFKISTSGDAIDVDVVQNEAGTLATQPIVTTTASVSRTSNSLTYQTASNLSDTAGTAYIEATPVTWTGIVGGAVGSATNGLLLSSANSGATAYDGTNAANGPAGVPSGSEKLAMRWTGAVLDVASSGALGTPGTYDGAMGLSSIAVGAGVNVPTYFKNLAVYSSAWTDNETKANVT